MRVYYANLSIVQFRAMMLRIKKFPIRYGNQRPITVLIQPYAVKSTAKVSQKNILTHSLAVEEPLGKFKTPITNHI